MDVAVADCVLQRRFEGVRETLAESVLRSAASLRPGDRPEAGLGSIERVLDSLGGADLGQARREAARCRLELEQPDVARRLLMSAIEAYRSAGETWQAAYCRRELAGRPEKH